MSAAGTITTARRPPRGTGVVARLIVEGAHVLLDGRPVEIEVWDPDADLPLEDGPTDPVVPPLTAMPAVADIFVRDLARRALTTPIYRLVRARGDRFVLVSPLREWLVLRHVAQSTRVEVLCLIEERWPDLEAILAYEQVLGDVARFLLGPATRRRSRADRTGAIVAGFGTRWKGTPLAVRLQLPWSRIGELMGVKSVWYHRGRVGLTRRRRRGERRRGRLVLGEQTELKWS
jgi:hypothetical protein